MRPLGDEIGGHSGVLSRWGVIDLSTEFESLLLKHTARLLNSK